MARDKGENILIEDDEEEKKAASQEEYVAVEEKAEPGPEEESNTEETSLKAEEDDSDENNSIREKRRQEKKDRRERRDKAINRDKIELNFLRQRNDELERRMGSLESQSNRHVVNDIDRSIQDAINEAEAAERIIAKAVEAGNGEDVTKAMRYRDQAITKAQQLNYYKEQQEQASKSVQPTISNEVLTYAKEFMGMNKWYDPAGGDEDSAIVLALDARLSKEGYDPRTEEYWDELQDRVERRLPERFAEKPQRKAQGGPVVGSGREHAPTSTRKEIYISPERKAAMQDAGVWDDPILRQRYIKRYAEYDRQNHNN